MGNENDIFTIRSWTEDQLKDALPKLETKFGLKNRENAQAPIHNSFKMYYPDSSDLVHGIPKSSAMNREALDDSHRQKMKILGEIYHRAKILEILDSDDADTNGIEIPLGKRVDRLTRTADNAYQICTAYADQYSYINTPLNSIPPGDVTTFRCSVIDKLDDLNPLQELLVAILDYTYKNNIKRYKGYCCREITTADEWATRAWKQVETIEEMVYKIAQKETHFNLWFNLTSRGGTAREVIKHLSVCNDIQFPEIKKDRHIFSFRNGIFMARVPIKGGVTSQFIEYGSNEYYKLDQACTSSKYFDKDFDMFENYEDWYDIPTPYMQSIMKYQKFDEEVTKWMYVFIGRLCYDTGDLDQWQVIPFLKGIARSGKSTLVVKVAKKFYESEDVKTLSNNIERKFGLGSIYDGLMFIAPEVKGDLQLEQAEFQSLVSGEDISVAVKNEKAKSITWTTPGILAGNEVPGWKDNSGSILRRLMTWNFERQVKNADPHLDVKLDAELPHILVKCIKAYLEYAAKHSDRDIWTVVPKYFKKVQDQVAMVTNSLRHFLASEKLVFGEKKFCPQQVFVKYFNQHCQENNLGRFKFNPDFYCGPFNSKDIEVRVDSLTYNDRPYSNVSFVFGIDIVDDNMHGGGTDDY
jgi:hypothetical protein